MQSKGELSATARLLLAIAIVFGIPAVGFFLIYSSMLVFPLAAAITVAIIVGRHGARQ